MNNLNFSIFIYGFVCRGEEEQFNNKLVHEFIIRIVNCSKKYEIWVRSNNNLARFGMQELCIITELPCQRAPMNIDFNIDHLRS